MQAAVPSNDTGLRVPHDYVHSGTRSYPRTGIYSTPSSPPVQCPDAATLPALANGTTPDVDPGFKGAISGALRVR